MEIIPIRSAFFLGDGHPRAGPVLRQEVPSCSEAGN